MASLQERNGSYRVLFCYHGKLHTFTIGQVETKGRQVDYLFMRLKQRLIVLPDGTDSSAMASLSVNCRWPRCRGASTSEPRPGSAR
jgi:hypothetical protein